MLILIKKNKLIKNIKFGKKKYNDQIVISNFKFQYTTFGKSIGLIKNQQKWKYVYSQTSMEITKHLKNV